MTPLPAVVLTTSRRRIAPTPFSIFSYIQNVFCDNFIALTLTNCRVPGRCRLWAPKRKDHATLPAESSSCKRCLPRIHASRKESPCGERQKQAQKCAKTTGSHTFVAFQTSSGLKRLSRESVERIVTMTMSDKSESDKTASEKSASDAADAPVPGSERPDSQARDFKERCT